MPATFALANDAGWRVATVTVGARTVTFETHRLFDLLMWDGAADVVVASSDMDSAVISQDATSFLLRFTETSGTGARVDIAGTALETNLRLRVAHISLGADNAALANDGVEWHGVVADLGLAADMVCFVPYVPGEVIRNPGALGAPVKRSYPFQVGAEDGALAGFVDFVHLYDDASREGLYVGSDDVEFRGRMWSVASGGAGLTRLSCRMYAIDDRIGSGGDSDMATGMGYGLELAPIPGEVYDGAQFYAARKAAAGHPTAALPAYSGRTDVHPRAKAIRFFGYISAGTDTEYGRLADDMIRLADRLGLGRDEFQVTLYRWHVENIGYRWPDGKTPRTALHTHLRRMRERGIIVLLYTHPGVLQADTPSYAALGLPAGTFIDADGNPFVEALGVGADFDHLVLNERDQAAVSAAMEPFRDLAQVTYQGEFDGYYPDGYRGPGYYVNHDPALDPDERGRGAAYPEQRLTPATWRQTWKDTGPAPITSFEFSLDSVADLADLVGETMLDVVQAVGGTERRRVPATSWAWGPQIKRFPYDVFGPPATANVLEFCAWNILAYSARGSVPGIAIFAEGSSDHFIKRPGDPGYAAWAVLGEPWMRLLRKASRIPLGYLCGRLLRPMPDSYQRWWMENSTAWQFTGEIAIPPAAAPSHHAFAFQHESDGSVLVVIGNYRATAAAYTGTLTDADYPELAGAMTAVPFDLDSQREEGSAVLVEGSYPLSVTVPGHDVVAFVLRPVGNALLAQQRGFLMASDERDLVAAILGGDDEDEEAAR